MNSERILHSKIISGRFSFRELGNILDAVDFLHFLKVRA